MVFLTLKPWGLLCRQFEGFVYVDGQLGREPGRCQVPCISRKIGKAFQMEGFVWL